MLIGGNDIASDGWSHHRPLQQKAKGSMNIFSQGIVHEFAKYTIDVSKLTATGATDSPTTWRAKTERFPSKPERITTNYKVQTLIV